MDILFLTTTNLSTNPRLLKELKLANGSGYGCTFIGFKLGNWSDHTEAEHLKSVNETNSIYLSTTKDSFINWFLSTFVWKLSIFFNKLFTRNLKISAYSHNKRTWQIVRKLKKIESDYDMVIAHNLGALYPAFYFSKKKKIPFAFDIEDYHPGEKCYPMEKQRREFLMQKLLPKATYITFASPLIGKYSLGLIYKAQTNLPKLDAFKYMATSTKCISRTACDINLLDENKAKKMVKFPDNFLITNSFSQSEFQLIENQSGKMQFVWFSQNITQGRGLEQILPALSTLKDKLQLHLIGNKKMDFYDKFLSRYDDFVNYIEPLPQNELNLKLSQFDIGLALEISSIDLNKDIALSNKIFAYTQAGLFVLATDTSAQKQFIQENNLAFQNGINQSLSGADSLLSGAETTGIGLLTTQSAEGMEKAIEKNINNLDEIRANKKLRFEYAKRLAWEKEGEKLLDVWDKLLK